MNKRKLLKHLAQTAVLLTTSTLIGCSMLGTKQPEPLPLKEINGKFSVTVTNTDNAGHNNRQSNKGSFRFSHFNDHDRLILFTPIGTQAAKVVWTDQLVTLTFDGKTTTLKGTPEAVVYAYTQVRLPISTMTQLMLTDQPDKLEQDGWRIVVLKRYPTGQIQQLEGFLTTELPNQKGTLQTHVRVFEQKRSTP